MIHTKIATLQDIQEHAWRIPRPLVFTNGCFDILHAGHVANLKVARQLGNSLVVGVNTDVSVRKLKGPTRPINNERDRAFIVSELESVNFAILFNELTPLALLTLLKPEFYVKGCEYDITKTVEGKYVQSYGGIAMTVPMIIDRSTTNTIQRIQDLK
jgi:D-glycero-beta-D-manno-heptose 1-phosphate adenylyltransferase